MMGNKHVKFGGRWDWLYYWGIDASFFLSIAGQMTKGSSVYSTLINHFEPYTKGFSVSTPSTYTAIETPKGEYSVFQFSNGSNCPSYPKIRASGSAYLQGLNFMFKHHAPANVITIIGAQDILSSK